MNANSSEPSAIDSSPPEPPEADPQGMTDYYENAPKPPEPPTGPECPPGTQPPKPVSPAAPPEEHAAYDQDKRDYEACVAANHLARGRGLYRLIQRVEELAAKVG